MTPTQTVIPKETITVSVDVTDIGNRPGKEVVQLSLRDAASRLQLFEKELKGFAKMELQQGKCNTASFQIGCNALATYDDRVHQWVAEAVEFEVLVGASSQDIRV